MVPNSQFLSILNAIGFICTFVLSFVAFGIGAMKPKDDNWFNSWGLIGFFLIIIGIMLMPLSLHQH